MTPQTPSRPLDPRVPADAHALLVAVTAQLTGTRGDHQAILTALETLKPQPGDPAK